MRLVESNGYILSYSDDDTAKGRLASNEESEKIHAAFDHMPNYKDGFAYKLRADTLTWELVETPTVEDEQPSGYTESELLAMTNAELEQILYAYGVSVSMNKQNLIRLILSMQGGEANA